MIGTVKSVDGAAGIITPDDGSEEVSYSLWRLPADAPRPQPGDRVEYELAPVAPRAESMKLLQTVEQS